MESPSADSPAMTFAVFDNGVRQRVVSVRQNDTVSLAIALDSSGSMRGPRIAKVKDATLALLGQLHDGEPLVVVGFSEQVGRLVATKTTPADARAMLDEIDPRGSTALFDGAYAAVLAGDTGTGSKLLVLLSDGRNNSSWLSARAVIDAARRHEVVIYPVGVGLDDRDAAKRAVASASARYGGGWIDYARLTHDAAKLLHLVAERTGGRLIKADWTDQLDVVFRADPGRVPAALSHWLHAGRCPEGRRLAHARGEARSRKERRGPRASRLLVEVKTVRPSPGEGSCVLNDLLTSRNNS
jgi:VWFA-related protein